MEKRTTNSRYFLFWIIFIIFLAVPVNALSCSNTDKVEQYIFEGETIESWGYVQIGKDQFCVYIFKDRNPAFSEIIVLDKNNNRVTGTNLQKSIVSYKTCVYLNRNYPTIEPTLDEVYNEFVTNTDKYNSNLIKEINNAVNFCSQFIELEIPIWGPVKINAVSTIKYIALDFLFQSTWDEILKGYKDYKETINQISKVEQRGWVSYKQEVYVFFENSKAINNLTKVVDNKTNSNLHVKFASLNFEKLAQDVSQESLNEVERINKRVTAKETEAITQKSNFDLILNELSDRIDIGLGKKIDISPFKQKYDNYKSNKPDNSLINKEMFQDYIENSTNAQKDIQKTIDGLNNKIETSDDKNSLFAWIARMIFSLKSYFTF